MSFPFIFLFVLYFSFIFIFFLFFLFHWATTSYPPTLPQDYHQLGDIRLCDISLTINTSFWLHIRGTIATACSYTSGAVNSRVIWYDLTNNLANPTTLIILTGILDTMRYKSIGLWKKRRFSARYTSLQFPASV